MNTTPKGLSIPVDDEAPLASSVRYISRGYMFDLLRSLACNSGQDPVCRAFHSAANDLLCNYSKYMPFSCSAKSSFIYSVPKHHFIVDGSTSVTSSNLLGLIDYVRVKFGQSGTTRKSSFNQQESLLKISTPNKKQIVSIMLYISGSLDCRFSQISDFVSRLPGWWEVTSVWRPSNQGEGSHHLLAVDIAPRNVPSYSHDKKVDPRLYSRLDLVKTVRSALSVQRSKGFRNLVVGIEDNHIHIHDNETLAAYGRVFGYEGLLLKVNGRSGYARTSFDTDSDATLVGLMSDHHLLNVTNDRFDVIIQNSFKKRSF